MSSQTAFPGTVTDIATPPGGMLSTGNNAWTNINNVMVTDGTNLATNEPGNGNNTDCILATNFGFSIPGGATINGIQVSYIAKCSNAGKVGQDMLQLASAGGAVGTDQEPGTSLTTSLATLTVGGSATLMGWTGASATLINSSTFGVYYQNTSEDSGTETISVDSISITVTYTGGGGGTTGGLCPMFQQSVLTPLFNHGVSLYVPGLPT